MDFCGKPLIVWTIEQALASRCISRVYVSTDDAKITALAEKAGAKVILRPAALATDRSPSEKALRHAISQIEKKNPIDWVVFLQATSPVRGKTDIDAAVKKILSERADSLFSAAQLEDFTVWERKGRQWNSLTFDYKNRGRRQDRAPLYLENGSIYVFKPAILKKYNNRLGGKIAVYEMDAWKSYEIDRPEDLEICEYFMRHKLLKEANAAAVENVKFIVYDCDGVLTDNKVTLNKDGREDLRFNRSDGAAMAAIKRLGIRQAIWTSEPHSVVKKRADKLGIPAVTGVEDKTKLLLEHCKKNGINLKEVVYLGNDLNDLGAMKLAGCPICPADACDEIKAVSKIVTAKKGGEGVARELFGYLKRRKNG
jgi:N-acylneuraminate cytidylyltransferase